MANLYIVSFSATATCDLLRRYLSRSAIDTKDFHFNLSFPTGEKLTEMSESDMRATLSYWKDIAAEKAMKKAFNLFLREGQSLLAEGYSSPGFDEDILQIDLMHERVILMTDLYIDGIQKVE